MSASLLTSGGTLICCALPALLVTIGAGAALAGLLTQFPQLIWFSENKAYVFSVTAFLLIVGRWLLWKQRNAPCPIEAKQALACKRLRRLSLWLYGATVLLFTIGAFFAFGAVYFL